MATTHAASSEAGHSAGPKRGLATGVKGEVVPSPVGAGRELEAAPGKGVRVDGAEAEGVESSASHLVGSSAADIHSVDVKFQRLLATVHENRPADDLEIIRKAWVFC